MFEIKREEFHYFNIMNVYIYIYIVELNLTLSGQKVTLHMGQNPQWQHLYRTTPLT
jgi:hypothetical protein